MAGSSSQRGGGGYMMLPDTTAPQHILPDQQLYQQGGGHMMSADTTAAQAIMPQQPYQQGDQEFNMNHVDSLVRARDWFQLLNYVRSFIPGVANVKVHPTLFLHILRPWVQELIANGLYDAARSFFIENIKNPYEEILKLDQSLVRNANLVELEKEIKFVEMCVQSKTCYEHAYATTGDGMVQKLICDYMMLYLPKLKFCTGTRNKKKLWEFAVQYVRTSRPTFRCLVCSRADFSSGTIGNMRKHLKLECTGPKTPYLIERCRENGLNITLDQTQETGSSIDVRQPEAEGVTRKRSRISETENAPTQMTENAPTQMTEKSILQMMADEVNKVEDLTAQVGVIHNRMIQSVQNMKGMLSVAQTAASTGADVPMKLNPSAHTAEVPLASATVAAAVSSTPVVPSAVPPPPPPTDHTTDLYSEMIDLGWVQH